MKRILLAIVLGLFLLAPKTVLAVDWITANQATVSWDAVTQFENGELIPTTDIIGYAVYMASELDVDKANPTKLGVTTDVVYTITMQVEGRFFVGLQTIRKLDDGTTVSESVIGWSDDPAIVADGKTFGISFFYAPKVCSGLTVN